MWCHIPLHVLVQRTSNGQFAAKLSTSFRQLNMSAVRNHLAIENTKNHKQQEHFGHTLSSIPMHETAGSTQRPAFPVIIFT